MSGNRRVARASQDKAGRNGLGRSAGSVQRSKRTKRTPGEQQAFRVRLAFVGLTLLLSSIIVRAWVLQVDKAATLKKMAEEQYLKEVEVPARRGEIYDRAGNAIAVSNQVASVFVRPAKVADRKRTIAELGKRLQLDTPTLRQKIESDRMFVWLKRRIDPQTAAQIEALQLPGVGTVAETRRYYPNRTLFSHVLGAVDMDGRGIEGVEASFEKELAGEPASAAALRDARGRTLLFDDVAATPGIDGNDLTLTVDRDLQALAVAALQEGVQHVSGKAGSAIVLDPKTGDILALANYPEPNPNVFDKAPKDARRNRAVVDLFEPGSTLKAITVAAALEEGVVRSTDQIYCENGKWKVGSDTIHDTHKHGLVSVKRIISSSSNIGTAKMAVQLGRERLHRYLTAFGFGHKSGLELPGEAAGLLRPAKKWPLIQLANVAFGQGIAVSTLQIAQAYATFANRGVLVTPRLVSHISEPDGQKRVPPRPAPVRVVSESTAEAVVEMLEAVVADEKNGTGVKAQIAGIRVAGKTATAQKVDPVLRGYSPDKYVANFAGFVPADAPRFVIVTMVDEPKRGMHFGGQAAAPIFQRIAMGALQQAGLLPGNATIDSATMDSVLAEAGEGETVDGEVGAPSATEPASEEDQVVEPGVMPDVRGLMLSEVIERMRKAEVRSAPEVTGSGRVLSQDPPPGAKVKPNGKVVLKLASSRREEHAAR